MVSLFLVSCSAQDVQDIIFPDDVKAELGRLNEAVLSGDIEYILFMTKNSGVTNAVTYSKVEEILNYVPDGEVVKIDLATANFTAIKLFSGKSSTIYNISYHMEFPEKWAMVIYQLVDEGDSLRLNVLYIYKSEVSYRELNAFGFEGKGVLHYLVFLWVILSLGFIIFTLVKAFRTKFLKRKVLWLIFIVLGITEFSLNWTTGAWALHLLKISLLGVGITAQSPYSPWILSISFPLGATLFWALGKYKN